MFCLLKVVVENCVSSWSVCHISPVNQSGPITFCFGRLFLIDSVTLTDVYIFRLWIVVWVVIDCIFQKINPFHLDYHIYGLGNAHIFHYVFNVHCLCSGFSSFFFNSFFFFFWLCFEVCEIFISKPGIKRSPAMEVQILEHWGSPLLFLILIIYALSHFCD